MAEGELRQAPAEGLSAAIVSTFVVTVTVVSTVVLTAVPSTIPFSAELTPSAGKKPSASAVSVPVVGAFPPRLSIVMVAVVPVKSAWRTPGAEIAVRYTTAFAGTTNGLSLRGLSS